MLQVRCILQCRVVVQLDGSITAPLREGRTEATNMKTARIFDMDAETFAVEYDNTIGKKHTMRLEATTYEDAIREARSFLGIDSADKDDDGTVWRVE